jgi:hypothetical protein
MAIYKPEKLHIKLMPEMGGTKLPRRYTLTHSDRTGDMFLTIARDYDRAAISGWYTRFMRDEVLGEWQDEEELSLHIHCHVSGGLVFGPAKWRDLIFREHLPMVLEAICNGDGEFISGEPDFRRAPIKIHFHAKQQELNRVEAWGWVQDFLGDSNSSGIIS